MLPVCLFNLDETCVNQLMSRLNECALAYDIHTHIELDTDKAGEVHAFSQNIQREMVCLIGIDKLRSREDLIGIKLSRKLVKSTHDHYIVLILKHSNDLEDVLSVCTKLSGVLCLPFVVKRLDNVFNIILKNHESKKKSGCVASEYCILVKAGGNAYRIPYDEVRYIQAIDKKIEVVTQNRTFPFYSNMSAIQEQLNDEFIRCHRSYIINRKHVREINWAGMKLSLSNGQSIPFSRSYREKLKEAFNQ